MTTLHYVVFYHGDDLMALPTAGRSVQSIRQLVGGVNWYGCQAISPDAAIAQAEAAGFQPSERAYPLVAEESPAMPESFCATIKQLYEDQLNGTL